MAKVLFWWLMFGGTHVLGSSVPVRTRVIKAVGLPAFKGIYSIVSFATFIPLCMAYADNKHAGAQLFGLSSTFDLVAQVLMVLAFVMLVQGVTTPSPMTTAAEMSGKFTSSPQGVQRLTRHPAGTGFALFGIAHCLANPFVGDWLFFGGFVVYAIVSALHQDRRVLASGPEEFKQFYSETSLIPFGAVLSGKQRLNFSEWKVGPLAASIVVAVIVRAIHGAVFGGFGG